MKPMDYVTDPRRFVTENFFTTCTEQRIKAPVGYYRTTLGGHGSQEGEFKII
jgi:hypothetical protein